VAIIFDHLLLQKHAHHPVYNPLEALYLLLYSVSMAAYDNPVLSRWLNAGKYWLRPGQTPKKPGVFLRFLHPKGNACVPFDKYQEFLLTYAEYILMTERPCLAIVEAHGPRFKMFIDVDMKLTNPQTVLDPIQFERLLRVIYGAVAQGTGKSAEMIVCTAEPYALDESGGLFKVGLHLHWPDIEVETEEAKGLCRDRCLPACEAEFPGLTDWGTVFDQSVFRPGAGLRLIASTKGIPGCKGTVYMPAFTVMGADVRPVEYLYMSLYKWLLRTSIHCQPTVGGELADYTVNSGSGQAAGLEEHGHLLDEVRRCISHDEFTHVRFTSLTIYPPQQRQPRRGKAAKESPLPILSVGLASKRCLNLRSRTHHTSNHVYLVVRAEGMFLKCFSRDLTTKDRRFGTCAEMNVCIGVASSQLTGMMARTLKAMK
jgi:hypothetical protein